MWIYFIARNLNLPENSTPRNGKIKGHQQSFGKRQIERLRQLPCDNSPNSVFNCQGIYRECCQKQFLDISNIISHRNCSSEDHSLDEMVIANNGPYLYDVVNILESAMDKDWPVNADFFWNFVVQIFSSSSFSFVFYQIFGMT